MTTAILDRSIPDIAKLVQTGDATAEEVTRQSIERIAARPCGLEALEDRDIGISPLAQRLDRLRHVAGHVHLLAQPFEAPVIESRVVHGSRVYHNRYLTPRPTAFMPPSSPMSP